MNMKINKYSTPACVWQLRSSKLREQKRLPSQRYRVLPDLSKRKKKLKATINSNHQLPVAENLLNQNFKTDRPATVWVTDISYIATWEGWQISCYY